jgi:hypothetical protein
LFAIRFGFRTADSVKCICFLEAADIAAGDLLSRAVDNTISQ